MKLRALFVVVGLLLAGCGGKKDKPQPTPDPGSGTAAKPPEGSGTAPGSGSAPGPGSQMTKPPNVPLTGEALGKHYLECVAWRSSGKLTEYKEQCIHPDVTIHEMDYAEFKGADLAVGYYEGLRTAMPDLKDEPQLVLVSGRAIVAINLLTGKHTGPLKTADGEVKATNKSIGVLSYDHIKTNEENKIVEEWEFMDHHAMMGQLGLAPKEAGPTREAVTKGFEGAPILLVAKDDDAEKKNIDLIMKANEAFNAHKTADLAAGWADDIVESDQARAKDVKGKAEAEKGLKELFAAFPDAKSTITHTFAAGDYVFVEGRLTGTNKGALGPMKATNKPIDLGFAEVFKIKGGKVAEIWRFYDGNAMLAQLQGKVAPKTAPVDAPKGDAPKGDAPKGDAPKGDAPPKKDG